MGLGREHSNKNEPLFQPQAGRVAFCLFQIFDEEVTIFKAKLL